MIFEALSKIGGYAPRQAQEKPKPLLKELWKDPDAFKLEAWVENGALMIKVKKKECAESAEPSMEVS